MPNSRVWATNLVLGSMAVAAFGGVLRGLSTVMESVSDNPDNSSKQPDSSPQTKSVAAIAIPETFATQTIATLATEVSAAHTAPVQTTTQAKAGQTKLPRSMTRSRVAIQPGTGTGEALAGNPLLSPTTYASTVALPERLSDQSEFSDQAIPSEPIDVSLNDIQGHWAQYYIEFLSNRNIIRGFPNGNFRPDQAVTANEFTTMAQKAAQSAGIAPIAYRTLQSLTPNRLPSRAEAAALLYRTIVRSEVVESVTRIQIKGDVLRPGNYSLAAASDPRLGQGNNLPTLSRALQQAGGIATTADLRRVEIHRLAPTGERKVTRIDVQKLLTAGDLTQDIVVQQDDVIVVPPIARATTPSQPLTYTRNPKPASLPQPATAPVTNTPTSLPKEAPAPVSTPSPNTSAPSPGVTPNPVF